MTGAGRRVDLTAEQPNVVVRIPEANLAVMNARRDIPFEFIIKMVDLIGPYKRKRR